MKRIEEARFLYTVSVDGVTYPVYARKNEEKTMSPVTLANLIEHGIPVSVSVGTMYSDYMHGLTEVLVSTRFNYIFVEAIEVPIAERSINFSLLGINTIEVKYKNGTKIKFVEDPTAVNKNQKAINQIKAHISELEKQNAVKDAFVKPREPEAPIEIEENEMPKVVVRYMGRNTLRNFFKFFGTNNWQYKEEGNKVWLRTPLGWEPLVDGVYIVLYEDGVFGTLHEDEFKEAYEQHSMWLFDNEGLAKLVINKRGIHFFGASLTVEEQKKFVEEMKKVSPVAVTVVKEPKVDGAKSHLAYALAEGGNEIDGYALINNKTGKVAAKFYDEALAKRIETKLNLEDKQEAIIKEINNSPMNATVSASKINMDNTVVQRLNNAESKITQTASSIATEVCSGGKSSLINQTATEIKVMAPTIELKGDPICIEDSYSRHRKDFVRNGRKRLFSYELDSNAPQMAHMAALQHEIVHMLTKEGYGENEREFKFTVVPKFDCVMCFRLYSNKSEFVVEVISTTNEQLSFGISFYDVGVNA